MLTWSKIHFIGFNLFECTKTHSYIVRSLWHVLVYACLCVSNSSLDRRCCGFYSPKYVFKKIDNWDTKYSVRSMQAKICSKQHNKTSKLQHNRYSMPKDNKSTNLSSVLETCVLMCLTQIWKIFILDGIVYLKLWSPNKYAILQNNQPLFYSF